MTFDETPEPLLDVRGVSKSFRRQDGGLLQAVRQASFSVGPGETVALVGESGSGKSTLARLVLGLARPDAGEIHLAGTRMDNLSNRAMRSLRLVLQPVFQDASAAFNPRRTVRGSMAQALGQSASRPSDPEAAIVALLDSVQLTPGRLFLDRFPHELSGGQRQRLGIAKALAVNPRLIVADEPLSGADVSIRGQVLNLLIDLQRERGLAYLFITHDMALARAFAHRTLVMYRGEIVEQGETRSVFAAPRESYTRLLVKTATALELDAAES